MAEWQIMEGNRGDCKGLELDEIAHVMIPGRGRSEDGMDLSPQSRARTEYAADFWLERLPNGFIVPSGYKTPGDRTRTRWTAPNGEVFRGKPEAWSMRDLLIAKGVGAAAIGVEDHSIDTTTNFTRVEGEKHFGSKGGPVAIFAQKRHLERIIEQIAPRTLRRPFLGIVVPERPGEEDPENPQAWTFSRLVLTGIRPDSHLAIPRTHIAASMLWGAKLLVDAAKGSRGSAYNTSN